MGEAGVCRLRGCLRLSVGELAAGTISAIAVSEELFTRLASVVLRYVLFAAQLTSAVSKCAAVGVGTKALFPVPTDFSLVLELEVKSLCRFLCRSREASRRLLAGS